MIRGRKRPPKQEPGGAPSWMNTYGDMVTLVLTMFVLLFSFSNLDAQKWRDFVDSFAGNTEIAAEDTGQSGLGGGGSGGQKKEDGAKAGIKITEQKTNEKFDELFNMLSRHITDKNLEMQLHIEKTDDVIVLHIMDSALFDSGKDMIRSNSRQLLDSTSEMLGSFSDYIKMIRIEGHTDDVPIRTTRFDSNWDLSTSRAVNVLEYLINTSNIDPIKFSAVGYGEFRPIGDNETDEGRANNRRVDFVIESINQKS